LFPAVCFPGAHFTHRNNGKRLLLLLLPLLQLPPSPLLLLILAVLAAAASVAIAFGDAKTAAGIRSPIRDPTDAPLCYVTIGRTIGKPSVLAVAKRDLSYTRF